MRCLILLLGFLPLVAATTAEAVGQDSIEFQRDIRPILVDHCFRCHGPSEQARKADLRLDQKRGLLDLLSDGKKLIVPGRPEISQLYHRITSIDDSVHMPPSPHPGLSTKQKDLIKAWIQQGAKVRDHWSLIAPSKHEVPAIEGQPEIQPIDAFLLRSALDRGLSITGQASRRTLIRRATIDITGLPPTRSEIDRFLNDPSPKAYERLLDRLLESPRYGEHHGRYWLSLVRYADTHGLNLDNYREIWPYRDWVIHALNRNMRFDQFIIEQLAGDLLPNATLSQRIASGFNRLNLSTSEAGSIYEEVFARNCMDRVNAFGTVFLATTVKCAACHDHKYDPVSTRDYYSLLAYFNSLDGRALDNNQKNPPPFIRVPTPETTERLKLLRDELRWIRRDMDAEADAISRAQQKWERQIKGQSQPVWTVLKPQRIASSSRESLVLHADGTIQAQGTPENQIVTVTANVPKGNWNLLRLDALADDSGRVGLSPEGDAILTEIEVHVASKITRGRWLPIKLVYGEADTKPTDPNTYALGQAYDGEIDSATGWAVSGKHPRGRTAWFAASSNLSNQEPTQIRIRLHYASGRRAHQFGKVRFSISDAIPIASKAHRLSVSPWDQMGPFPVEYPDAGYHRMFASEGTMFDKQQRFSDRKKLLSWVTKPSLVDGAMHDLPVSGEEPSVTVLHRAITATSQQRATLLIGSQDGLVFYLNGEKIADIRKQREFRSYDDRFDIDLKEGVNHLLVKVISHGGRKSRFRFAIRSPSAPLPKPIREIIDLPLQQRTANQRSRLSAFYQHVASTDPAWSLLRSQYEAVEKQIETVREQMPTTLVWKERKTLRPCHVLERGQYDRPGELVSRAVPSVFPPLPEKQPNDRLALARWLVDPTHPLTARVVVNRLWQQLMGVGIVETSEDFGTQGTLPSHPELLDWLAVDFQQQGWNVKRMLKQIMMSQAYRRSAAVSQQQFEMDPMNRLLARGPRFRLDAEVVRDQALYVSGLLVEQIGGPSVKPPQPKGLWNAVGYTDSNTARYRADTGDKIYRRSLYTFWKRTSPPPWMTLFGASTRETCTARRHRGGTPQQVLALLNEEQYLQCARALASILLKQEASQEHRIQIGFETVTGRLPTGKEQRQLRDLLNDVRNEYEQAPALASQLIDSERVQGIDSANHAAWIILANTLLNLEEVVTR